MTVKFQIYKIEYLEKTEVELILTALREMAEEDYNYFSLYKRIQKQIAGQVHK